jgi:hypothetical protein
VVADDIVDVIGRGVALPKKTYPGRLEWGAIALHGERKPYLAMAQLFLSAQELEHLGLPSRDVWCPVGHHIKSHKIRIIE